MNPGNRVASPRSIVSAPAGMAEAGPTATIFPSVTTTTPGEITWSLLPSNRWAALSTVVLPAATIAAGSASHMTRSLRIGEDNTMRKLLPVATLMLIGAFAAYGQTVQPMPGPVPPGWRPLFNGRDLDGWAVADAHGKPGYTVEDGAIRTQPGSGLLWYTREKIGDATLRVVY